MWAHGLPTWRAPGGRPEPVRAVGAGAWPETQGSHTWSPPPSAWNLCALGQQGLVAEVLWLGVEFPRLRRKVECLVIMTPGGSLLCTEQLGCEDKGTGGCLWAPEVAPSHRHTVTLQAPAGLPLTSTADLHTSTLLHPQHPFSQHSRSLPRSDSGLVTNPC